MRALSGERLVECDQYAACALCHRKQPRIGPDLWRSLTSNCPLPESLVRLWRLGDENNPIILEKTVIHAPSLRNGQRLTIHRSRGRGQAQKAKLCETRKSNSTRLLPPPVPGGDRVDVFRRGQREPDIYVGQTNFREVR